MLEFYKVRVISLKSIIITVFEYAVVKRRRFISDELLANFRHFVRVGILRVVHIALPTTTTFALYSIRVRDVTKRFFNFFSPQNKPNIIVPNQALK